MHMYNGLLCRSPVLHAHELLNRIHRRERDEADAAVDQLSGVLGHVTVLQLAKLLKVHAELWLGHAGWDARDEDARCAVRRWLALQPPAERQYIQLCSTTWEVHQ